MTKQIVFYGRHSSDLQNPSSIEDQFRICAQKAQSEGWEIIQKYYDAALSGASMQRPGLQNLLNDAQVGGFTIVLAEALERVSRDQEESAHIFKKLRFLGIKLITLAEGEITPLHIGLKGTMNQLMLEDLKTKTRRGMSGLIKKGKSAGGKSYGYRTVKQFDAQGHPILGDLEIVEEQAVIIRRIFNEYAVENKSPRTIAAQLNKEGIPGPTGKGWSASSINGNKKRDNGLLRNQLYVGVRVWNRTHMALDPYTGKKVTRMNPESEWVKAEVPDLRILPQKLWDLAKARQDKLSHRSNKLCNTNRPRYLLSGLIACGQCGGSFVKRNAHYYGCTTARNKGDAMCSNHKMIKGDYLEAQVLSALQTRLMREDLLAVFCEEYTRHVNALIRQRNSAKMLLEMKLDKLKLKKAKLIQAITDGVPASVVKDELVEVAGEIEACQAQLSDCDEPDPFIHPSMSKRYRQSIEQLNRSLNKPGTRAEASEHLRELIEKIVLTPKAGQDALQIDLYGDLAGILSLTTQEKTMKPQRRYKNPHQPVNDNRMWSLVDSVGGADGTRTRDPRRDRPVF